MSSNVTPFSVEANGSKSGSPSKPNREKHLIAGIVILAIILIGFVIAVIILAIKSSKHPSGDVCTTAACFEAALDIAHSINTSADPCEDFYKFACGNWGVYNSERGGSTMEALTLESFFRLHGYMRDASNDQTISSNIKKIAESYIKCGEYKNLTEDDEDWLDDALGEIGGWPMTDYFWNETSYNWERNLALAIQKFVIRTPILLIVTENIFDTRKRIIQISQPQFEETTPFEKDRILYVARQLNNKDELSMEREYKEVEEYSQQLRKISRRTVELAEDLTQTKVVSLRQLKELLPWINWPEFLRTAFGSYLSTTIHDTEQILVSGIDYLSNMLKPLFQRTVSKRTFANYLAVTVVQNFLATNMWIGRNTALISSTKPFNNLLNGFTVPVGFSTGCFTFFTKKASLATDFINYRRRTFPMVDENMLSYFTSAMNDLISGANWLDDTTKKNALKKLHKMKYFIGFPERSKDPIQVERYFAELPDPTSNVLKNQQDIERHHFKKSTQLLRIDTDKNKWPIIEGTQGSQINAFNVPDVNAVVLAADMQVKPMFDAARPKYWNFGLYGWVIGHEITHGFDTSGSKRDDEGNFRNWWMPKTKEEFDNRAKCMVEQYNKIPYGYKNYHVNGTQTAAENVADNGGLRQAYVAYKKWEKEHGKEKRLPGFEQYNTEQLFFIAVAQGYCSVEIDPQVLYKSHVEDTHSPTHMRFNPAGANFDAFAKAFKCKSGSPMNPVKKCVVW